MKHARNTALVAAVWAVLLCSGPASAETCDGFEELFTTTPAPPQNPALWRFYSERLAATPPGSYDLLLLGDSLAELWPDASFSPLKAANLGVGGDGTQHLLWRLESPEMKTLKLGKVLIVIGTNNLGGSQSCAIAAGISKVVEKANAIWPSSQIAFLDIPPRGVDFKFNNDRRLATNAAVRQIPDLRSIDVDDAITCRWKAPCVNYGDDNLHFSEAGYRILGKAVRDALFRD
jgi:lysophospholipase L1-like esterase